MSNDQLFVKVAECLYRNRSSETYFALVKRKGKQIRKSLETKDRKLAERRLREFKTKAKELTADSTERKTPFKVLAERWLDIHNPNLKDSSADRNARCVKELNKFFAVIPISEITKRHCEDWMKKRGAAIEASTFNKEVQVLQAVLKYAMRDGLILDNPALVIKRRKSKSKVTVIPTREEYEKLLVAIEQLDPRAWESKTLVQLLALSGMRLGEATRIKWREVNFKRNQFTVSGGDIGTKNGDIRVVPLFPKLQIFLKALHKERSPESSSNIISIESTKSALGSACKKAGLPHFTHHSLRHYFVSNAIEVGVDFKTIAAWIGHKDGGILVTQTYGHLRPTHSMDMAALLA